MKSFSTFLLLLLLTTVSFAETATNLVSSGDIAFQQGQFQQAITRWEQALRATPELGKQIDIRIRLATGYRVFGLPEKAIKVLKEALTLAEDSSKIRQSLVLTHLSELYLLTGKLDAAKINAVQSVEIARQLQRQPLVLANALNNRGMVWSMHENTMEALKDYQEAFTLLKQHGSPLKASVLINKLKTIVEIENTDWLDEALPTFEDTLAHISSLPTSYAKIMKWLSLTQIGIAIQHEENSHIKKPSVDKLNKIIRQQILPSAQKWQDNRLQSYAYGYLGELSEIEGCFSKNYFRKNQKNNTLCTEALSLTRQALFFSHETNSLDALYRWQWQMGRLLTVQSDKKDTCYYLKAVNTLYKAKALDFKKDDACYFYQKAVKTLEKIRSALTSSYLVTAKGFRDSVQPVYFGLVDLLLQHATQTKNYKQAQQYLRQAIRNIETFKRAELENYFKDDCITTSEVNLETVINNAGRKYPPAFSKKTAVLYPVILPERIELLLLLPNRIVPKTVPRVKKKYLKSAIRKLHRSLKPRNKQKLRRFDKNGANQLYKWLIQPIEDKLVSIKTLVIVPHDILLTLPFAALYDKKKKQYLVQKNYSLVISLGFLSHPQAAPKKVEILLGGLSEAVDDFERLPYVPTEISEIHNIYGGKSPLLDRDFTIKRIENELKIPYTVVHLATHAEFNRNPAQSFILTYGVDNKLTMTDLENFRQEPLELLTLSACQTAKSDDERAALGLAGVAVKASAKSVLASLWRVDDKATSKLMPMFYRQLQNFSKAQALQEVQKSFLAQKRYKHPYYWAGFVLSGNWLSITK